MEMPLIERQQPSFSVQNPYAHDVSHVPIHRWYTLVAGFSGQFVKEALHENEVRSGSVVLDPFSGMGTSVLAAAYEGMSAIGVDANPFAHFVASVKARALALDAKSFEPLIALLVDRLQHLANEEPSFNWQQISSIAIKDHLSVIRSRRQAEATLPVGLNENLPLTDLPTPKMPHLVEWLSPRVLTRILRLKEEILRAVGPLDQDDPARQLVYLAFASILRPVSNMQLNGPKISYRRKAGQRLVCTDAPVVSLFLNKLHTMVQDLSLVRTVHKDFRIGLVHGDSRLVDEYFPTSCAHIAITSPPYLNEVDYLDNTRLELYFLDFVKSDSELRAIKRGNIRANSKYLFNDNRENRVNSSEWSSFQEVYDLSSRIRTRWESRDWGWDHPRLVEEYFLDMARHLEAARKVLQSGASYIMMIGDSAIDGVLVPTDEILAAIGKDAGFSKAEVKPFRWRGSSRHGIRLRESIVTLHV